MPAVVWGTQDEIFPLHIGQRLASSLDAPLFTIDGGTHVLPVVSAPQTVAVLQSILRQVASLAMILTSPVLAGAVTLFEET
jgi:pimeloyl-ACP methyl ester carboxylesterase